MSEKTTSIITYVSCAITGYFGDMTANKLAVIIGIIVALVTLVINIKTYRLNAHYKRLMHEDAKEHQRLMREIGKGKGE